MKYLKEKVLKTYKITNQQKKKFIEMILIKKASKNKLN